MCRCFQNKTSRQALAVRLTRDLGFLAPLTWDNILTVLSMLSEQNPLTWDNILAVILGHPCSLGRMIHVAE